MQSKAPPKGAGAGVPAHISRRGFLRAGGAVGSGLVLFAAGSAAAAETPPSTSSGARQWAMVVDLRKCEGCVTQGKPPQCAEGCNTEHYVPSGQQWMRVMRVEDDKGSHFLPRPCMHCENAPCLNVCPVGATFRTNEGTVLVNHERCIGCRMCMAACPYGARSFNWAEPENPPGATFAEYSPDNPLPHRRGTVEKCTLCAHTLKDGKLPACASACPMNAIYLGDLVSDRATNGKEVVKLSRFISENNAFRLKEELGTRPRVWYVPGHGQDFGRTSDDPRESEPPRSWEQIPTHTTGVSHAGR